MAIVYFLIEEEDLYVVISRLWSVAIANKETVGILGGTNIIEIPFLQSDKNQLSDTLP